MPRYYGVSSGNQERRRYANHPAPAESPTKTEANAAETARIGTEAVFPEASPVSADDVFQVPDFGTEVFGTDFSEAFFEDGDEVDAARDFVVFFADAEVFEPLADFCEETPFFNAESATTDTSTGVFEVHSALSTTNASRYVAGTDFPITDVDVQNRFLPSEKSQYERDFGGIPSTLNDTGQVVEKQTYRYFPDGKRSTPEDGRMASPSGGRTGSFENPEAPLEETFLADLDAAALESFADFKTEAAETAPDFVPGNPAEATDAVAGTDDCEGAGDVCWYSSGSTSGNPGKYETRSAEYPENEVVSVSGTTGNHEDAVRREAVERLLIRNSEAVEASVRKVVLSNVVPLNQRRRTDQEIDANLKNPVVVVTFSAYSPPVLE